MLKLFPPHFGISACPPFIVVGGAGSMDPSLSLIAGNIKNIFIYLFILQDIYSLVCDF